MTFTSKFVLIFLSRTFSFTGEQKKGKRISLTPHYHLHPLNRHLDINPAITVESLPLHIASSQTQTGNLIYTYVILTYIYIAYIYKYTYTYI